MEKVNTDKLKELLVKDKIEFSFKKKDGSLREAKGTLNSEFIPESMLPKEDFVNKKSTNLKYFDLEKNAWRSLSYDCSTVSLINTEKLK